MIAAERFFRRIPPEIAESFTQEQIQAISRAVYRDGKPPVVNIRISLPVLVGRVYLAVMAGRERRGRDRLREERWSNPLITIGNFLFVGTLAALLYITAMIGAR